MAGFNDFMDKAGAFASKAAEKAKDLAGAAAVKTKQVSRIAKLNMDISAQKDTIKKAYAEIGRLYYEAHHDAPDPTVVQACGDVDTAKEAIAKMEAEIAQLKAEMGPEANDADFESVVDETAAQADVEVEVTVEEPAAPEEEPKSPFVMPDEPQQTEAPAEPEQPEQNDGPQDPPPAWQS